jgi:hypothetical protein
VYKPHWLHYYITLTGSLETCIRSTHNLWEGYAKYVLLCVNTKYVTIFRLYFGLKFTDNRIMIF